MVLNQDISTAYNTRFSHSPCNYGRMGGLSAAAGQYSFRLKESMNVFRLRFFPYENNCFAQSPPTFGFVSIKDDFSMSGPWRSRNAFRNWLSMRRRVDSMVKDLFKTLGAYTEKSFLLSESFSDTMSRDVLMDAVAFIFAFRVWSK